MINYTQCDCAVRGACGLKPPKAFSLIEVLVVVAIIALLISLLLPSFSRARAQARSVQCSSNLRQIGMAMSAYSHDYADRFPIAQYVDERHREFVAWDTITPWTGDRRARAGLIWEFADGGEVQQCPVYEGPNLTLGDPFTGYNYNTTYIGRGQNEGPFHGMDESPAMTAQLRRPSDTALCGDGGYRAGANKFMRAPLDEGVSEGTVHAGAQAFRHAKTTLIGFSDGHATAELKPCRKLGARPENEALLDWPDNGFLSPNDRLYSRE